MKAKDLQDFWKYIILGVLACVTVLAIGYLANGLFESILTILGVLLLVWIYLILKLIFRRAKKINAPFTISPGDYDHLDQLQERALSYCDENINYYQGTRYSSRRYYVNFQLATAILTGITPILILIDKSETLLKNVPDLKNVFPWLIIVVPAVASILTTTTTVFNFQDDWVQSKKTAESLEALREEYLIGASDLFRLDLPNKDKHELARRALENFILKVNEIHLQQVDRWASLHSREQGRRDGATLPNELSMDQGFKPEQSAPNTNTQHPLNSNPSNFAKENNVAEGFERNKKEEAPGVIVTSQPFDDNKSPTKELIVTPLLPEHQPEDEMDDQVGTSSEPQIM